MRLVFVDDSEHRDPPRRGLGDLLAIGAVMVPEVGVRQYAEGLQGVRDRLGVPPEAEIKWSPPRNSPLRGAAVMLHLREEMLDLA
jgi:hypothetical protein